MSYEIYKMIHLVGIVLLFSGLMGLVMIKLSQGRLEGGAKALVMMSHGLGLVLILLGGFGLLARLGLARDIPHWAYAKLVIWLFMGAALTLIKRKANLAKPLFYGLIATFILAAYLAIYKPF